MNEYELGLGSKLVRFGLTSNQVRMYLFLLSRVDPVPARVISKELDIHRVDTYRTLRELENLGLAEFQLMSPRRYSASDPQAALSSLLTRSQTRFTILKNLCKSLEPELKAFQKSHSIKVNQQILASTPEATYRVVSGRANYYREVKSFLRHAKSEVLRIISATGMLLTFRWGIYKDYRNALQRGVSIRLITETNKDNLRMARMLSRIMEVRHLEGVNVRFTVMDKSAMIFGHKFDDMRAIPSSKSDEGDALVVSDPKFAESARFLFEHLWKIAEKIE